MIADHQQIKNAQTAAIRILANLALMHPCEMEIEDISWARGVLVKNDELIGSEGRLVKLDGRGVITFKTGVRELGRRRFTIAHELGHFELHKSVDQLDMCGDADFRDDHNGKPEEREANSFATELLMPGFLLEDRCRNLPPTWESVKELAKEFQTTITISAIRLVTFSSHRLALILSERGQVKWYRASETLRYRIRTKEPIDERSYAAGFFKVKKTLRGAIPVDVWIKSPRINPHAIVFEDCFPLPRYESVLSLVWIQKNG